ncbi:hypothetical protein JMJ58_01705 [Haloterrigena salifodinae]|uniref:Uncharacterized protein n=1 Tax=Haloterrigena salifodinae TaxID=2675099 RepID=A0A8T8E2B5_9EURY|nr:hypothetical protein [Haloterrigena salifodinae]QRV15646.1 hypothetical protein JMJ58_01705 [Haloterrigena salifodinae]
MTKKTKATTTEDEPTRIGDSIRRLIPGATAVLLLLAVTGGTVLGLPAAGTGPADDPTIGATDAEAADDVNVTVKIDCDESDVLVTAPDDEYGLSVVNVGPSGTSTSTSRRTPLAGNATVTVGDADIVYAFVTDASTGEPITSAVAQCVEEPRTETTDGPSIAVDCNESAVRFTAPDAVAYTARVSSVDVSPTGASTSTVSGTVTGNATVPIGDDLIVALASTDDADDPIVAIRDCGRTAGDERSPAAEPCSSDSSDS